MTQDKERARWNMRRTRYELENGTASSDDITKAIETATKVGMEPYEILEAAEDGEYHYKISHRRKKP